MRTASGSDGAENYALALLLLTDGLRGNLRPSSFMRDALTSSEKLEQLYNKQIPTSADYFATLPARNLKEAFRIYSSMLSISSEKAKDFVSVSRELFISISENSDIALSQGGTGLETFDQIMDLRNRR